MVFRMLGFQALRVGPQAWLNEPQALLAGPRVWLASPKAWLTSPWVRLASPRARTFEFAMNKPKEDLTVLKDLAAAQKVQIK